MPIIKIEGFFSREVDTLFSGFASTLTVNPTTFVDHLKQFLRPFGIGLVLKSTRQDITSTFHDVGDGVDESALVWVVFLEFAPENGRLKDDIDGKTDEFFEGR